MAVLTPQVIVKEGIAPTFAAAASGGDTFTNSGREYVHVKNGGAGAIVMTVDATRNCNQGFDHNQTVSVPAGGERLVGPLDPNRFNNDSGVVSLTYDIVTSVTVGIFRLP